MPSTATNTTVTGLTNGTSYIFRVAAVNGVGVGSYSSASAAVTAAEPIISITSQPSNQTASAGSATFSVTASVTVSATLSYQWQRSTDSGSTWANVSGATASSLSLTGLINGSGDGHRYRVIVSATGGATSVTSNAVTLTVQSGPVFSNVSVSVPRNYPPNIATTQTATVSGNNTSVLSIAMSIPNGTIGGNLRVAFTVTESVIMSADDVAITGGDGAGLAVVSSTNQPGWLTDKFGNGGYASIDWSYSGTSSYNATQYPSPAPTRLRLLAGTYNFNIEFYENTTTAKTLSAVFTLTPAQTGKVFDHPGGYTYPGFSTVSPSQGLWTKKLIFSATDMPNSTTVVRGTRKYHIHSTNLTTDTAMRLTASSDSYYILRVPSRINTPAGSSPHPQAGASGWSIGTNGGRWTNSSLTGSQDFTIWALESERLTAPDQYLQTGIEWEARPTGVRSWSLEILS